MLVFELAGALLLSALPSRAADLSVRLTPAIVQQVFPGAEQTIPTAGRPLAVEVRIGGERRGYIFSTLDTVNATGYAGYPFDLVGGITLDGAITGAVLLQHRESIIGRGVGTEVVERFLAGFAAASIQDWQAVRPDLLRGATTSGRIPRPPPRAAAIATSGLQRLRVPSIIGGLSGAQSIGQAPSGRIT